MASIEINQEDRIQFGEWHRLWGQEKGHTPLTQGPDALDGRCRFHGLPEEFLDYLGKKKLWFKRLDP
jgi:hypothetical protein